MRALLTLVFVLPGSGAAAADAIDAHGLAVQIEPIAEPIVVDGVAMHVRRAQGRDIESLARRIEQRWRTEASPVLPGRHDDWQIRSRWSGLRSEVIQWRGAGPDAELLHSWFDVSARRVSPAPAPVNLPPQCAWVRSVSGTSRPHRYLQMTARCRIAPPELQQRLPALLERNGWIVVHQAAQMWEVARSHESARITLIPGSEPRETALVWLATAPESGS